MMISALSPFGSGNARAARHAEAPAGTTETSAGSGRISTANNRPINRLSAEQLFAGLDRDGKGYLTAADFVRISPAGARAAAHAKQNERAQQLFERMDTDSDGQLSDSEFKAALASMIAPESHGKAKGVAKFGTAFEASPPPPPAPTEGDDPASPPVTDPPLADAVEVTADGSGTAPSLEAAAALQTYASVAAA